jgi:flagellar hook-length control protein FliK
MLNKKGVTVTQNSTVRPDEINVIKRSDLNLARTPINDTNGQALDNAEMTQVTQRADKVKSKIKPKPLGKIFDSEKNSDAASNEINKTNKTKSDLMPQQGHSNGAFGKDLSIESNLAKESVGSASKLDANITSSQGNSIRAPISNNQTSNGLLNDLNMLSKSWGEKLIEKIEKSIVDGIEKIELSLSPKSLGKLNVTINMQDSVAKINIVAESSSVAALLGEAEAKLSQMMEATGLKLASLQTLTQQFGQNKKGKEQAQKLVVSKKKDNISDPEKTNRKINNKEGHNEGLNLIA